MNKKFKMITYSMLALCMVLSGSGVLGETIEISNTLDTKGIAGEIVDGEINWGQVEPLSVVNTATISDTQTINNQSVGYAVDVKMQVKDFTGSDTNTLIASWDGTPDIDEFEISIPAISHTLQSNIWSETLYSVAEYGSEAIDFELEMGTGISIVDTYSGVIRVSLVEAL